MSKITIFLHQYKRVLRATLLGVAMLVSVFGVAGLNSKSVQADAACTTAQSCASQGIGDTCPNGVCPTGSDGLNSIIATALNILSVIAGVAAVIMIIVGGLKYITSSGDSAQTNGAKNTILFALVGLVIVVLAQVIVHFVLKQAANAANPPATTGSTLLLQIRRIY